MPWDVEKRGDEWVTFNKETGDIKGRHKSRAKANAQLQALFANVPDSGGKSIDIDDYPALDWSYVGSILTPGSVERASELTQRLAVKSIGRDEIQAYTFLWGSPAQKDIERDYFTKETNFWDDILGKNPRPLSWDHAQDETFKASPIVGTITDFGDDDVGRWYTAHLDRAHKYRKAIDAMIERGLLGSSSDSASQYVRKVKKGMSNEIVEWPWFASALTDAPCEPRMLDAGKAAEFFKSLGVSLPVEPETSQDARWLNAERLKLLKFYTEEA